MDHIMTEERRKGSGICWICFNKIENYDVLPDQESQKIFNSCWKYLHESIANSKLQTAKSIDENQQQCCKKCFEAASLLIQLSDQLFDHLKKCEKQISDLSFEFSLGVLARRTQVESVNNKSEDSPKDLIVLDISRMSPSLFSMDPPNPTKTEDFDHPCANSFVETDAVFNVPQYRLEIMKQEFNEYYDDNSQTEMLECPEETTNLIDNHLIKVEDIQDGVTISNTTRKYPASRSDMGVINNVPSQIDDSAGSDSSDTNCTQEVPVCRKPAAMFTKLEKTDVSKEFNYMSFPQNPPIKHPLRSKTSQKKNKEPTTCSNIILVKTGSGNLKKKSISGSSLEVHARVGNGQTNQKCTFCEKVLRKSSDLKTHIRIHTQEKPFKCSVCKKTFSDVSNLRRHKITHTGERPFKCSFCVKAFARLSHAKTHERSHTGEKPFKCSFCEKYFTSSSNAKRHERMHQENF